MTLGWMVWKVSILKIIYQSKYNIELTRLELILGLKFPFATLCLCYLSILFTIFIYQVPRSLSKLGTCVSEVTWKKKKISRCDFQCKSHKNWRIHQQSWKLNKRNIISCFHINQKGRPFYQMSFFHWLNWHLFECLQ